MERAKLARAASALNARYRSLPALMLMTDEKRLSDPAGSACCLPKGSAIILRHTNPAARSALAMELLEIARARGLRLLIAGDAALAQRIGAHGLHLPEARLREAAHWKTLHPSWVVTVAAHSEVALTRATQWRADAALLAPAFPTKSHSERPSIGVARFRLMSARAGVPVYALGGVNAHSIARLAGANLAGIAAIEGLAVQSA
jgi:thiamine-phosphate pyrophosphorylase